MTARRGLLSAIAVVILGTVVSAALGGPLVYDGAFQLFVVLEQQGGIVAYGRYTPVLMELPVVLVSRFTSDMGVLRGVFNASYILPPIVSLAASWLVVWRRAPHLMVWPILGICLVCLPVAMYFSGDAVRIAELAWPLLLMVTLRLPRPMIPWAVVMAAVLYLLHPLAALVFLVAAAQALLLAIRERDGRRRLLAWAGVMVVLVLLRLVQLSGGYEASTARPTDALAVLLSLRGRILVAYAGAWVIGLTVVARRLNSLPAIVRRVAPWVTAATLLAIAAAMLQWASRPLLWGPSDNYRDFALILELPLIAMLTLEAFLSHGSAGGPAAGLAERHRGTTAVAAAAVFAAVLAFESYSWQGLTTNLQRQVAGAPGVCVDPAAVSAPDTVLTQWPTPSLALVLQDRDIAKVVVDDAGCRTLAANRELKVSFFYSTSVQDGWFRFPHP